jgi:hypothetical protein
VVTWSDITERKLSGRAVAESQRLLQTVIDTTPMRVFWKDRNSAIWDATRPLPPMPERRPPRKSSAAATATWAGPPKPTCTAPTTRP